jgi:hypothetical protein
VSLQIVPAPQFVGLSHTKPGDLVIWNGLFAFVCTNPQDPLKRLSLAILKNGAFEYHYLASYPDVTTLGSDLLVVPTIDAAIAPTQLGPGSGTTLFLHNGSAFVVLTIPAAQDWRVLDLSTGLITPAGTSQFLAIPKWRLGIPDYNGERVWVLNI